MKKQKCRFRKSLGIILAAGMIISGINFAVLPVSADGGEDSTSPAGTDQPTADPDTVINPDGQAVNSKIIDLFSLEDALQKEEQNAIREQVPEASESSYSVTGEQMPEAQSQEPENAESTSKASKPAAEEEPDTSVNGSSEPDALALANSSDIYTAVYNRLTEAIKKIAAGSEESTTIEVFDLILERTTDTDRQDAIKELGNKSKDIETSLLVDCQNELFWHDKEIGISFAAESKDGSTTVTFSFAVSAEYQKNNDKYMVDSQKIQSANSTLSKAQEIVDANADKSDYEKLLAYKNAICELVSYDTDAAAAGSSAPDASFQMISVFDGDPNTNVVCEGYSKAFQYLCDLSVFKNAKCYTVSGEMAGGTGAGGHMWNIVSIGGSNYLVDVTNCDESTVGAPDLLFMAIPTGGNWNTTYTFAAARDITYSYNADSLNIFGENVLKLSTTAYDPTKEPEDDTSSDDPGSNKPGTSDNNKPGTSDNNKPGTSDNNKPGTSGSNKPGTSDNNKPGTSGSNKPGTSDNNKPGTSGSNKPGTSNNNKPGTSGSSKPGSNPSSKPDNTGSAGNSTGDTTNTPTAGNTNTAELNWTVKSDPSDQNSYRLDVSRTIEVPAELLSNENLNTAAKIESLMRNNLTARGISGENIRVYDVALQIYVNGVWQDVTAENFPAEGVTVTVPYPAGTDSSYDFAASHLFTKSMNGYPVGHVESFPEDGTITKTGSGISFTVHGLSPISIGWSKASGTAAGSTSTSTSPKTGDHSPIALYLFLMILAAAVIGTVHVRRIHIEKR